MVEEEDEGSRCFDRIVSAETLLSHVQELTPLAIAKAKEAKEFVGRWMAITSRLHQVPDCVSDLSSHPLFYKSSLCMEQLETMFETLEETIQISELCSTHKYEGKLHMQSDLDNLSAKLDLNLHDCFLLMKTGVLGDAASNLPSPSSSDIEGAHTRRGTRELLARLQIGHMESKHRTLDRLTDAMKRDENGVIALLRRRHVASLVQLLTTTSPFVRDKAMGLISSLTESAGFDKWLVSEGALPPLLRLVDSGSSGSKRKAAITLQKLSFVADTARSIVAHGGARPLVELCESGDVATQAAAVCALKNMASVPETRHSLVEEMLAKAMVRLLDTATTNSGTKQQAAWCLYHLTSGSEGLRRRVVSEGAVQSLLRYMDGTGTVEKEGAMRAVKNLVGTVPVQYLVSQGLVPRLAGILRSGSAGAQQAAAAVICAVCVSAEMKKMVGEAGCVRLLVGMLETTKKNREAAVEALWMLMTVEENKREVKRDERSVGSLVRMMEVEEEKEEDEGERSKGNKYAVSCLVMLSSCRRCRKEMISHGAMGYLKKLGEMDMAGARKLQERLEKGRLRLLFRRKW